MLTTLQLHRLIIGEDVRCQDTVCDRILPADQMTYRFCPACWAAYKRMVVDEKNGLQEKLTAIARRIADMVPENSRVDRAARKLLDGPRVFRLGVIAREVSPDAVNSVLTFAYAYAQQAKDKTMSSDVLLLKSRL